MIIAGAQFTPAAGDAAANLAKIRTFAAEAKKASADLLILPELAVEGYGAGEVMREQTIIDGKSAVQHLQDISEEYGIALISGLAEVTDRAVYNSAAFMRPGDAPVLYRKSHLYGPYEKGIFTSSDPMTVIVPFGGLKIGLLICFDVEFPENVRRLAKTGADMIAVPTATPLGESGKFISQKMLPTRAFENQIFIAYINFGGSDGVFTYQGGSGIHAPDGELLAGLGNGEGLILSEINPDHYATSRAENTYLQDLKPGQ